MNNNLRGNSETIFISDILVFQPLSIPSRCGVCSSDCPVVPLFVTMLMGPLDVVHIDRELSWSCGRLPIFLLLGWSLSWTLSIDADG